MLDGDAAWAGDFCEQAFVFEVFFTHDVMFTGPLKNLFGRKLGKGFREMLPNVMNNLRLLAEK